MPHELPVVFAFALGSHNPHAVRGSGSLIEIARSNRLEKGPVVRAVRQSIWRIALSRDEASLSGLRVRGCNEQSGRPCRLRMPGMQSLFCT